MARAAQNALGCPFRREAAARRVRPCVWITSTVRARQRPGSPVLCGAEVNAGAVAARLEETVLSSALQGPQSDH